jgi:hypothetical protein
MKEEELNKKINNVSHGHEGGYFNALFSHSYNCNQIIFLNSSYRYFFDN